MKKKNIISIVVILLILSVVIVATGYIFGFKPSITSISSENKTPNFIPYSPTIPLSTNPPATPFSSITFDFDRGTPMALEGQNTPLQQTSGGVTASFSSSSDPAAFSIQSYKTTFYTLSQFSGKFLYDNKITRDILYIAFSQPLTKITFTFATVEYEGAGHIEEPSTMKLTTYMDSIDSNPINSTYAKGEFSTGSLPQGTLVYDSYGNPFNLVKIELLPQYRGRGGTDFLIDTIIIVTV